jgi:hypothetical protein
MFRRVAYAAAVVLLPLITRSAMAFGPADYVYEPGVDYGEREIDFKAGSRTKTGEARQSAASLGFGYGVTQHWFTEIYQKYERAGDEGTHVDAWEWENKFQLGETGEYPVDAGFIAEVERPKDRTEGYEARFGPLFQTEIGLLQLNGNLLFERHYRAQTQERTDFGYQWQIKYRWRQEFEFGLQGFGEVGKWNQWDPADQQSHRLGPAAFGKLPLGNHRAIRYNAAWLLGASANARSHTFRMQAEYEF